MASSLLCAAALLSCAADPMHALQRLPYGRLRGGGTVLSQLAAAPQLTAELEAARAQLDATQKAARKARREQRRREAFLQAQLDALEAARGEAEAPAAAVPPLPLEESPLSPSPEAEEDGHADRWASFVDLEASAQAPATVRSSRRKEVGDALRIFNSAVLLAHALVLVAVPERAVHAAFDVELGGRGAAILVALLGRLVGVLLAGTAMSLWLMTPHRATVLAAVLATATGGFPPSVLALTEISKPAPLPRTVAAVAVAPAVALINLAALASAALAESGGGPSPAPTTAQEEAQPSAASAAARMEAGEAARAGGVATTS